MKVLVVLVIAMAATVGIGVANADPPPDHPMPVVVVDDHDHVQVHASMTEQMRVMGADGRMGADAMWTEHMTPGRIGAEEQHHADMDRMLGRASG